MKVIEIQVKHTLKFYKIPAALNFLERVNYVRQLLLQSWLRNYSEKLYVYIFQKFVKNNNEAKCAKLSTQLDKPRTEGEWGTLP